ncbi:MAG: GntR family transcriptional regulator [Streptosporangiales bacterium]|nr:GntR family transcriptional regulator [Streptosporangiales bacterium]
MAPSGGRLKRIERVATSTLIAEQLREAIMSGTIPQGSQLGEADLAARFGVSRGPLREAMQRLVQEGLVRSERHRGLFVTELASADIEDIYVARTAIERAAVDLVVDGSPEDAAGALDKVVARMLSAADRGDSAALSRNDLTFHEVLVTESGSARLRRMASTLLVETRMCLAALPRRYFAPHDLAKEHQEIAAAIRGGDRSRAHKLLDAHMQDAISRLTAHAD